MSVRLHPVLVLLCICQGPCFLTIGGVAAQADKCGGLLEAYNIGDLQIRASNSTCVWMVKLPSVTGIRLEVKQLTMEPVIVIPEQMTPTSNLQSVWIIGPKNIYTFQGQMLVIVAPPKRLNVAMSWSGETIDNSEEVTLNGKFERSLEGRLEWLQSSIGTDKVFWAIEPEATGHFNWELNSDLPYCEYDNPCQCISFGVVHVLPDGSIVKANKMCEGSSVGSLTIGKGSKILVFLQMNSSVGAGSNLQVRWKPDRPVLKRNVMGIIVGTSSGLFVMTPNPWHKMKIPSKDAFGVAFDWNHSKKMYWVESAVGIRRANVDGTGFQQLISDDVCWGVGIEPITGNLYYCSQSRNSLRVCSNDAEKCATILSTFGGLHDLAFESSRGFLFWSVKGNVFRANLDGTDETKVVDGNFQGIDVDEREGRLYVGTSNDARGLISCDLDGHDVRKIQSTSGFPYDVQIDDDRVYIINFEGKSLHVEQGTSSTLIARLTDSPFHLALFGEALSRPRSNPCESAKCAHLCVLITVSSYRCLCPDGKKLRGDGFSCSF